MVSIQRNFEIQEVARKITNEVNQLGDQVIGHLIIRPGTRRAALLLKGQ